MPSAEALQAAGVGRNFRRQHLQRDAAGESLVAGPVDLPHPTPADERFDLEALGLASAEALSAEGANVTMFARTAVTSSGGISPIPWSARAWPRSM